MLRGVAVGLLLIGGCFNPDDARPSADGGTDTDSTPTTTRADTEGPDSDSMGESTSSGPDTADTADDTDDTDDTGEVEPTVIPGTPATDFVASGGVAENAQYRMILSVAEASPYAGVGASPSHRLQAGMIGAAEDMVVP
jgi:hypothetical protein